MPNSKVHRSRSPILEAMHETVTGLQRIGLVDQRTMKKFDALCLAPIPAYTSAEIKAIRQRLNLSQPVFAKVLNTSPSTVKQWEIGEKHPSGPSLKLLNLLDRKGLDALL